MLEKIHMIKANLTDSTSLQNAIKQAQPEEIYNLAAQSSVTISFQQPISTVDVTGVGVMRILEALRQYAPAAKFYQTSSSEMYGDSPGIKDENSPFKPRSPYGCAKIFAHHITVNYRESYNIFACCGILFNHESPLRGMEFVTRKITSTFAAIKMKKSSKLHLGNINIKRDWGFAGDYVKTMWLMLQQSSPKDYIIAIGESHTLEEFLTLAAEYAGIGDWQDHVIIDESIKRPADVEGSIGDASKARDELEWKPQLSFKELVKLMIEHDLNYYKS